MRAPGGGVHPTPVPVARVRGTRNAMLGAMLSARNTMLAVNGDTAYAPTYDTTEPRALRWSTFGSALVVRAAARPPHFANNTVYVVFTTPTTELVDGAHLLNKWSGMDATNSDGVHVFFYNQRLALQWRLRGGGGNQMALYTVFSPSNLSLGRRYVGTVITPGIRSDAASGVASGVWVNGSGTLNGTPSLTSSGEGLLTPAGQFDLILGASDVDAGTAVVPDTTNGARETTLIHEVRFYRGRHDTARRTATEAELRCAPSGPCDVADPVVLCDGPIPRGPDPRWRARRATPWLRSRAPPAGVRDE